MPIDQRRFRPTGISGCRWDSNRGEALFDVVIGARPARRRVIRVAAFPSREAAKAAFASFREEMKRTSEGAASDPIAEPVSEPIRYAFAEYVDAFWESLHARCGEAAQRTNRGSFNRHVRPFFGAKDIGRITEADCEDFAASMRSLSPYATNLALRFVRKVLHHARRRKLRSDVPENFHFAKEQILKLELTDSEQDRFFAAFDDRDAFNKDLRRRQKEGTVVRSPHFGFNERRFGGSRRDDSAAGTVYFERFRRSRLLFTAAVDTGYRVTDLRLLKRTAVDLAKGVVAISTRKTGKRAVVGLSDRCREAIEEAMAGAVTSAEYVFTTEEGRPYSEETLRRYFALAKKLAGITRRCRLNDLRHTFASNLASEGLSLLDIRDALGHTTARMSERYAKPNEQSLERMREALNTRQQRSGATLVRPDAQESGQ